MGSIFILYSSLTLKYFKHFSLFSEILNNSDKIADEPENIEENKKTQYVQEKPDISAERECKAAIGKEYRYNYYKT